MKRKATQLEDGSVVFDNPPRRFHLHLVDPKNPNRFIPQFKECIHRVGPQRKEEPG